MATAITVEEVAEAMGRVSALLQTQKDYLTSLDQAMGDGDMGITLGKIGQALETYIQQEATADIGKFLAGAGMAANKAAPSTMGTLLATALMRAGKVVKGKTELSSEDLAEIFQAADVGIQERGKAKPGDKTVVDAIHPAAEAFAAALAAGASAGEAAAKALQAAETGRDEVTPLRSKIGRASWVGERTEGLVDPGCQAFVMVFKNIIE
ncbi:MAG: DAK2 domain-containing protein [Anaerolineae bacterium]|nr:DAK2 domain-containing protein [Anaerolineae bacterium]